MTRLRLVPYRDLKKIAEAAGFHWVRSEGSHNVFRNPAGNIVVIPDHGSQVIVRSLLRKILRDLCLTIEDYRRLLDEQ
ncbi:MAG: type II toxin-antitoxin system HicA family toxin [Deltaproteobacteria bacterium]|nr:type II toxin-antitoxin system HicA family toxin [Deltaproteobacteria bacterium]